MYELLVDRQTHEQKYATSVEYRGVAPARSTDTLVSGLNVMHRRQNFSRGTEAEFQLIKIFPLREGKCFLLTLLESSE